MTSPRLVTSPGDSYVQEMIVALEKATSFTFVTAFATVGGVDYLSQPIRALLERGGAGRIIVAVDRQGFNTAATFEALLALRRGYEPKLSLGLVLQGAALLHAKALFTDGPLGPSLLVGSANLTKAALGTNHELGLVVDQVPAELRKKFLLFVNSVAPRSLDGPDARDFLYQHGLLAKPPKSPAPGPPGAPSGPTLHPFQRLPPAPPLEVPGEAHLSEWVHNGYIVGRGRRTLDALVLRLPQEQLLHHGFIDKPKAQNLGTSSHETQSMGYGIDLIPTKDAEQIRRDARRISYLLAKVCLNLPCFGLWMPKAYWDVFVQARDTLAGAHSLSPDNVIALAEQHRGYLDNGGIESEVDTILDRLEAVKILVAGKRDATRSFLLPKFKQALTLRTPRVLGSCVEFRTARQCWTPYEQTERPFRQLMVDVIQATFSSTYRTGSWPSKFRSLAAREVASAIADRLEANGFEADSHAATSILDQAATWDDASRAFPDVLAEMRALVPDSLAFTPPTLEDLVKAAPQEDDDEA